MGMCISTNKYKEYDDCYVTVKQLQTHIWRKVDVVSSSQSFLQIAKRNPDV